MDFKGSAFDGVKGQSPLPSLARRHGNLTDAVGLRARDQQDEMMTKDVTRREGDDRTTSRGTVKGHHAKPGDDVTEGGPAAAPTEGHGAPKGAASTAAAEGAVAGDNTSSATVGKLEKEHAQEAGLEKTQSGRGHRKHDA